MSEFVWRKEIVVAQGFLVLVPQDHSSHRHDFVKPHFNVLKSPSTKDWFGELTLRKYRRYTHHASPMRLGWFVNMIYGPLLNLFLIIAR